jgi:hypothetical protein
MMIDYELCLVDLKVFKTTKLFITLNRFYSYFIDFTQASTILTILNSFPGQTLSIMDITKLTSILVEDVIATLHMLGILVDLTAPVDGGTKIEMTAAETRASSASSSSGGAEKYVLLCPPDLLKQAMLKYPPGQLPVSICYYI